MEFTKDQLVTILGKAFQCGQEGCYELRSQYVQEILEAHEISSSASVRIYKIAELVVMPVGTTFHHPILGKGWIKADEAGKRFMLFEKNARIGQFNSDGFPWTEKMQMLPGLTLNNDV